MDIVSKAQSRFVDITSSVRRWAGAHRAWVVSGVLIACILFIFLGGEFLKEWKDRGKLIVTFLDVGQGDAAFIRFPNGATMLIDSGPDDRVVTRLGEILPFWKRDIDTILLTHPQADHVGGFPAVLERYRVHRVVMTGVLHTLPEYMSLLSIVTAARVPITIVDRPFSEYVEGTDHGPVVEYVFPQSSFRDMSVAELNDTSIVLRVKWQGHSFLFTGDIEEIVEEEILHSRVDIRATVLKVAHHGSDTSSSVDFLERVLPQYAVISSGAGNRFGHPSRRVLRRLERLGTTVWRTDSHGNIRIVIERGGALRVGTER